MTEQVIGNMTEGTSEELTLLKQRADQMGIKYSPNIGVDTLRERINAVLTSPKQASKSKSTAETVREYHARLRREANRLVRIRLTCMDPAKKNWPGEIITVANGVVGTIKKYVPYQDNEAGYHVPQMIYDFLKERKYQSFKMILGPKNRKIKKGFLANAYSIEELPPLTPQELKDLAQRQAMNNSIDQAA